MKDNRLVEMKVFKAIAETGSFTAAAHVLGVSQSQVSKAIKTLEQRIDVPLINRSTRGQQLTLTGSNYLELCNTVLQTLEEGEEQLLPDNTKAEGELRVSAPVAFGKYNIVSFLPIFSEKYPGIKLIFSMSDHITNLIEENIDIAIRMGTLEDSCLISRKLCHLNRIVVASPEYVNKYGSPQTPYDLKSHHCLIWHGHLDHLNKWPFIINNRKEVVTVKGTLQSSDSITLSDLSMNGAGIMRMTEHLAKPAIKEKKLVPLLSEYHYDDNAAVYAVYLNKHRNLLRVRTFVDFLVTVMGNRGVASMY